MANHPQITVPRACGGIRPDLGPDRKPIVKSGHQRRDRSTGLPPDASASSGQIPCGLMVGVCHLSCSCFVLSSLFMWYTLSKYPFVVVRIGCEACKRQGSYRLARLAAKFTPEILLPDLLKCLTADCPWQNPHHPYQGQCQARYIDLEPLMRPPDAPRARLQVIQGSRSG
jgi:hypothetical protein